MLTVGDRFPAFSLPAVAQGPKGPELAHVDSAKDSAGWRVFFAWPMDFTFVCPTEIAGFGKLDAAFRERDARVYGLSCDSEYVHLAWRKQHEDLKDLPFPMLADRRRELCASLGILHGAEGVPLRATFVVDPEGIIRHVSVNDLDVGRSPEEVLRILDGLQTGELCPCNWKPGERTLQPA